MSGAVGLGLVRTFLQHHPSEISESYLLKLYHEQVHPAFPILPHGSTDLQPPSLLSMILATSMSHSSETRPLAAPTCAMIDAGSTPLPEHNIVGVASAVLELGMRPIINSRSSYLLLAKVSLSLVKSANYRPWR